MKSPFPSLVCVITGLCFAWPMKLTGAEVDLPTHLRLMQWTHRIILWHQPDGRAPANWPATLREQEAAFKEYRLAVFAVNGTNAQCLYPGQNPESLSSGKLFALLRDTEPGASLLIGLDGGVKERQAGPLDWNAYYAAIEQMPIEEVRAELPR